MMDNLLKDSGKYPGIARTWPLWLLGIAAITASLIGGDASPLLRYQRSAVLDGELWRVMTGQLVHLGSSHLVLNLAGLALVGWIFGPGLRAWQWVVILAGSWIVIVAGFLLLEPQLEWYVGLSGLLHGLLLGAALVDDGLERRMRVVLVIGILAKLAWEQWAGALPMTAEAAGGPVVVDAHLYGGIGGLLAGMSLLLLTARQRQRSHSL